MDNTHYIFYVLKMLLGGNTIKKTCLYNIICKCPCTLEVDECEKSIAGGRCGRCRGETAIASVSEHSWERSISKSCTHKTKFITVRHKNNDTLAARHEYKCYPSQHVQPWQNKNHPEPIGPSCVHAYCICVYVDSYSFSHSSLWSVVYWAWLFPPGTPTPPPPPALPLSPVQCVPHSLPCRTNCFL